MNRVFKKASKFLLALALMTSLFACDKDTTTTKKQTTTKSNVVTTQKKTTKKATTASTTRRTTTAQTTTTSTNNQVVKHTIKFVNYDNTELYTTEVNEGETPVYGGAKPVKQANLGYTCTFNGWDSDITAATGDKTYVAQYREYLDPDMNCYIFESTPTTCKIKGVLQDNLDDNVFIIPEYVTEISNDAFNNCGNMFRIVLYFIGDKRHERTDEKQFPFAYIFGKESFTIGNAAQIYQTYIGTDHIVSEEPFLMPIPLTTIQLYGGEYLPYGAFSGCNGVTEITLVNFLDYTDSIKMIETYAFKNCGDLKKVVLGKELEEIKENAFYGCTKLEEVYYAGSETDWNSVSIQTAGNGALSSATMYFYSEEEPTTPGNYWHYYNHAVKKW